MIKCEYLGELILINPYTNKAFWLGKEYYSLADAKAAIQARKAA